MSCLERNDECLVRSSLRLINKKKNEKREEEEEEEDSSGFEEWKNSPFFVKSQQAWKPLQQNNISLLIQSHQKEKKEDLLTFQKKIIFQNSNGMKFSIQGYSEKGEREYQEDRFLVCNFSIHAKEHPILFGTFTLVAVFDGHGGSACSSWLCETSPFYLIETFQNYKEENLVTLPALLYAYFERLNKEWNAVSQAFTDYSGSTHTMWLFHHESGKQCFANLGDSRTVLVDTPQTPVFAFETNDHDFSAREMARIEKRSKEMSHLSHGQYTIHITSSDGKVKRIEGILALSRAHGDNQPELYSKVWGHKVDKIPDVAQSQSSIQKNQLVVLGSDGIWDECTTSELIELVHTSKDISSLNRHIKRKTEDSEDNKTCVLVWMEQV